MVAILRDSTVVVVRTRPRAIPLAMITTRKSINGFPLVSYMGMGLRYDVVLSVLRHQSFRLHILHIFQIWISPELTQMFTNGKRHFYSFVELYAIYAIHLKKLRGENLIIIPFETFTLRLMFYISFATATIAELIKLCFNYAYIYKKKQE